MHFCSWGILDCCAIIITIIINNNNYILVAVVQFWSLPVRKWSPVDKHATETMIPNRHDTFIVTWFNAKCHKSVTGFYTQADQEHFYWTLQLCQVRNIDPAHYLYPSRKLDFNSLCCCFKPPQKIALLLPNFNPSCTRLKMAENGWKLQVASGGATAVNSGLENEPRCRVSSRDAVG